MNRRFLKVRDGFPKSADEYTKPVGMLLQHRRAGLDATWDELEEKWEAHNKRAVELEVRPRTDEEGMVRLNVGGSNVSVFWHLLAEIEGFQDSILSALLEGVWGKGRVPLDSDGRIVLDESPACIKHALHAMLTGRASSVAEERPRGAARSAVAVDEVPCLIYTAHVMGLPGSVPTHPKYVKMNGGNTTITVLEPFEIAPLASKLREWVGGSTGEMTLIYRATRDGFGSEAFTARCNKDSPKTISLLRVSSGQGNDDDSVVGGYSTYPWDSCVGSYQLTTPEMFVFMLKDGCATRNAISTPVKWHTPCNMNAAVLKTDGPYFGHGDLGTIVDKTLGSCTLQSKPQQFLIGSPLVALDGKKVVEIEVYRYSTPAPPTTTAPSITEPGGGVLTDAEVDDVRSLGEAIASSLMEERVVLDRAIKEMEAADARVSAAVGALKTVYGPSVAAGEQDAVVDLNVRGTRMTTLRSTLQACPRSALAAMFNEDRWPATDKYKDEHGWRLIDCSSTCFSKILDVLRMRKRASWGRGVEGGRQEEESRGVLPGGVLIKQADEEELGEAVNRYFPGCESFIMDLVLTV